VVCGSPGLLCAGRGIGFAVVLCDYHFHLTSLSYHRSGDSSGKLKIESGDFAISYSMHSASQAARFGVYFVSGRDVKDWSS